MLSKHIFSKWKCYSLEWRPKMLVKQDKGIHSCSFHNLLNNAGTVKSGQDMKAVPIFHKLQFIVRLFKHTPSFIRQARSYMNGFQTMQPIVHIIWCVVLFWGAMFWTDTSLWGRWVTLGRLSREFTDHTNTHTHDSWENRCNRTMAENILNKQVKHEKQQPCMVWVGKLSKTVTHLSIQNHWGVSFSSPSPQTSLLHTVMWRILQTDETGVPVP